MRKWRVGVASSSSSSSSSSAATASWTISHFARWTRLHWGSDTAAAAATLGVASTLGWTWDAAAGKQGGFGSIVSLVVGALLASCVGPVPSSHGLYDFCWTRILPASLAIVLLTRRRTRTTPQEEEEEEEEAVKEEEEEEEGRQVVSRMMIPFGLACVGSYAGCALAALSSSTTAWMGSITSARETAMAAGCLCASYIGGSVNFFGTARFLLQSTRTTNTTPLWVSSMAAADVLVMALYFPLLTAMASNRTWQSWFPRTTVAPLADTTTTPLLQPRPEETTEETTAETTAETTKNKTTTMLVVARIATMAGAIVEVSHRLDQWIQSRWHVAGMGTTLVCALSTLVRRLFRQDSTTFQEKATRMGSTLSAICFHLFFAAIGCTSAQLSLSSLGWNSLLGWSFRFSLLALLGHGLFLTIGCGVWQALWARRGPFCLSGDEILIASNAAIGGSATAAAFAASLPQSDDQRRQALIVAATVWGVVGYAVGTTVGVFLTRQLLP